jgi:hypothetical protein
MEKSLDISVSDPNIGTVKTVYSIFFFIAL